MEVLWEIARGLLTASSMCSVATDVKILGEGGAESEATKATAKSDMCKTRCTMTFHLAWRRASWTWSMWIPAGKP